MEIQWVDDLGEAFGEHFGIPKRFRKEVPQANVEWDVLLMGRITQGFS